MFNVSKTGEIEMTRPKKERKAEIRGWLPSAAFMLSAGRPGATLGISVVLHAGVFGVFAVSTPGETLEAVMENHGHRVLGKFSTLTEAEQVAEAFARDWIKGTPIDRCGCEEIPG